MSGESKSDLSRENASHLGSHCPKMVDLIYNVMPFSESDSEGNREVFMVGQGDAPADQIEEEIAQVATMEIKVREAGEKCKEGSQEKAHVILRPEWRSHRL
jgi:hypothetical protein